MGDVDSCGRCRHDNEVHKSTDKVVHTWKCSSKCKPLTEFEVNAILDFKSEFEKLMRELLPILSSCDNGCPNTHYGKVVHETGESNVPRKGHSMLCFIDSNCKSRHRILRLASTHYPSLRSFLHAVNGARNIHLKILKLDEALSKGDFSVLMKASSVSLDTIFSLVKEHVQEGSDQTSDLGNPDLELCLHVRNAEADYQKAVDDFPKNVCCSCHQLHQRKNVTVVKFDDQLGTAVWRLLKEYMLKENAGAAYETHFMCSYCKHLIKRDKMPSWCILNGLHVVEVPPELSRLDCLSKQFIQLAEFSFLDTSSLPYFLSFPKLPSRVYIPTSTTSTTIWFLKLFLRKFGSYEKKYAN